MKKFLVIVGYYRKLIKDFSFIAEPLNAMQRKQVEFVWSNDCNTSFERLRSLLASSPIVRIADPNSVFILKTDASKFGVGCILEQIDSVTHERYVIAYASKRFDRAAANYRAMEQESYGLIFALKHCSHYLIGKHFKVETDSSTVQWLQNKRDCLKKLGRWSLYLQNFDFETSHVPGKLHVGPCDWAEEIESDPEMESLLNDKIVKQNNLCFQW